jgi:hypothetical protein
LARSSPAPNGSRPWGHIMMPPAPHTKGRRVLKLVCPEPRRLCAPGAPPEPLARCSRLNGTAFALMRCSLVTRFASHRVRLASAFMPLVRPQGRPVLIERP